jgi:hypothetical protein
MVQFHLVNDQLFGIASCSGPLDSEMIFSGSDFMWWGNDDPGTLSVDTHKFDLRFHAASIDGGVHNRVWIRDFSVHGNIVQRIPPVAVSPRDFVDEWIVSSWKDALTWSASTDLDGLRRAHDRAHVRHGEFDSVRKCSDGPERYQIAVTIGDGAQLQYFQVTGNQNNYKMKAVGEAPASQCNGPDLIESMATQ